MSLKIIDAKYASGFLFPAIDRETLGDVWLTFIRSARTRISLATLVDFAESRRTQLTVGVLSQYRAICLYLTFTCCSSTRNNVTKPSASYSELVTFTLTLD